ncbi:MAG: ribose 5-phosphate isomerase B [Clostridiales bacterium]
MKIVIGSDHAGFELKKIVTEYLTENGVEVEDLGPYSNERVDYPIYGQKVGEAVSLGTVNKGIVICGSGIGISIAANKVKGVRAALCSEPLSAKLAREHNDANVLAMGARIIGEAMALEIVETFLHTEFKGGRHQKRIDLLSAMD